MTSLSIMIALLAALTLGAYSETTPSKGINPVQHSEAPANASKGINPVQHSE